MLSLESQKKIKLLFRNLFIFFVAVFIVDFTIGSLLRKIYFKQNHGQDYGTTYILEKDTSDMVILGSSRANHHYIASAFTDSLHISCYNAGRDGHFILYQCAVLKGILKRHRPQIVVLDLLDNEFEENITDYERLSTLLPYYKTHEEIRPIVNLKSPFEKIKMVSSIYPFNSRLISSTTGALDLHNKKSAEDDRNGYRPLYGATKRAMVIENNYTSNIDTIKVKVFEDFIKECKDAGVNLKIIMSPIYKKFICKNRTAEIADSIAKKHGVIFEDYMADSRFIVTPNKYFKDTKHLNAEGAALFSNIIIKELKGSSWVSAAAGDNGQNHLKRSF